MTWRRLRLSGFIPMLAGLLMAGVAAAQPMRPPSPINPQARASHSAGLNFDALQPGQQAVVAVVLEVASGFHAQSHEPLDEFLIPYRVTVESNDHLSLYAPIYPEAEVHDYPALGKVSVYEGRVIVYVPLEVSRDAPLGAVTISGQLRMQICDDQTCFPPETRKWEIQTQIVGLEQTVSPNQPELFEQFDPRVWSELQPATAELSTDARDQTLSLFGWELRLDRQAYLLIFTIAFFVGIIFNIVPCVLPVLPLKAIGFYEVAQHNRAKCLALGAIFGLGIVATFGALAVPVLVLKVLEWGELFGNPWFAGSITLILLAMAAQMFGMFGVDLPQWVYRITPRHDTYAGNFLFGILTAVLSTPCTFGLFLGLLVWAATQPAAIGVSLLMVVGLGMASPYLVLSAFPELARRFPRTGPWSNVVKQMMGFLLVAVALYFGQIFLPVTLRGPGFWWVLFVLVAAAGLFLVIRGIQLAPRALPVTVCVVVALLMVGPALAVTLKLANPPLQWTYYDPQTFAEARASGKPVVVKFTATWCANCHTVEAIVFGDERTVDFIRSHDVVAIKADLTSQSAAGWDLLRELHPVGAIPFTAVFMPGEASPRKLAGIYSSQDLMTALRGPIDVTQTTSAMKLTPAR
jgi:thiol:disulfide interchange protein